MLYETSSQCLWRAHYIASATPLMLIAYKTIRLYEVDRKLNVII